MTLHLIPNPIHIWTCEDYDVEGATAQEALNTAQEIYTEEHYDLLSDERERAGYRVPTTLIGWDDNGNEVARLDAWFSVTDCAIKTQVAA